MLHHAGEKMTTRKRTIPSPGTIATGTVTSSDAVVSDYTNWCWHAESSESWLLNFNPTQESNNQSHTTPEMRPPPPHISANKHSNLHISPTGGRDISYLSLLTEGENKIRRKGFSLCRKSAPILQFCLFPCNTSRSALQATNNRIGNLQSFNLTGALNI